MKEETYVVDNLDSFELAHIFECGQCFRWNKEQDGSFTGVVGQGVINVKKNNKSIIFTGVGFKEFEKECIRYFDLNRDYEKIKKQLALCDEYLRESIKFGYGIRILNQDLWETIISFIISANNNIPRIKGIIERISKKYGNEIVWKEKQYYTFPTVEQLSKATVAELRELGLGFRDKRVYETTKVIYEKEINLEKLLQKSTNEVKEDLLKLSGVGGKVADCILLFSLHRFEVFPIDVWIRRVMNDLYIRKEDENEVSKSEIAKLAEEKYGNLAGLAQQYLFFWRREM